MKGIGIVPKFSLTPGKILRGSVPLGHDNDRVYRELLGVSADEIEVAAPRENDLARCAQTALRDCHEASRPILPNDSRRPRSGPRSRMKYVAPASRSASSRARAAPMSSSLNPRRTTISGTARPAARAARVHSATFAVSSSAVSIGCHPSPNSSTRAIAFVAVAADPDRRPRGRGRNTNGAKLYQRAIVGAGRRCEQLMQSRAASPW